MGFFKSIFGTSRNTKSVAPNNESDILSSIFRLVSQPDTQPRVNASNKAGLLLSPNDDVFFKNTESFVSKFIDQRQEKSLVQGCYFEDDHGTQWIIINHPDFRNLIEVINELSKSISSEGLGSQMIAAVFKGDYNGENSYWICNYRTSKFYPFVPNGKDTRNYELEMELSRHFTQNGIPVEPPANWYPLWDAPF